MSIALRTRRGLAAAWTANSYGSEVYVTFVDCHYQKDTVGSRQVAAK